MFESEMRVRKAKHEAMHDKIEKRRKDTDAKISAVLTDEQKKKFEERQKNYVQKPPHMPVPKDDQVRPMREKYPDHQE